MTYPEPTAMDAQKEEVQLKGGSTLENRSDPSAIEQLLYMTSGRLSQALGNLSKVATSNATHVGNISDFGVGNATDRGLGEGDDAERAGNLGLLNEIQLIKAVVLMVVVSLLLLSTCTVIFRTFSVFSGKKDDLQM